MAANFRFKLIVLIGKVSIMKDIIKELIIKAKSEGFYVYAPRDITSYFYISKDNKIGYCQFDRLYGVSYSTVHKPNIRSGTGFNANSFEDSLAFCPFEFRHYSDSVIKYKSFDEFKSKYWQELIEY